MTAKSELGSLEASGLISIAALEPELEYLFRHALVQEAAYSSLLKQDRKLLHRSAAENVLALHPSRRRELASVIAMHFELAGEPAQAAPYFLVAGEHALERFANREARAFFIRAHDLAGPDQAELRLSAAIGLATAGWTFEPAAELVQRVEAAIASAGGAGPAKRIEAYFWAAFLRRQQGETPESSPALQAAIDGAAAAGRDLPESDVAALPRALLGSFTAFTGRLRDGAREMAGALDAIERRGDPVSTAMIGNFLALTYGRLGEFEAADAVIRRATEVAGKADDIAALDVKIASSGVLLERGQVEEAFEIARDCSSRAEELGAFACVVAASALAGAAGLALDDVPGARPPLERGNELCQITNMAVFETLIHAFLGSVSARLGDLSAGRAGWDRALGEAHAMGDRYAEAQTLWGRAGSLARQPAADLAAALADLDHALELFTAMEAAPSIARVERERAGVLGSLGRQEEARRASERAAALAKQLGGLADFPTG